MAQIKARTESKLEARLKVSKEKNRKVVKALFEHFLGGPSTAVAKGKGIMGAPPPGLQPREYLELPPPPLTTSQTSWQLTFPDHPYRLDCPRFDGIDLGVGGLSWNNTSQLKEYQKQTRCELSCCTWKGEHWIGTISTCKKIKILI